MEDFKMNAVGIRNVARKITITISDKGVPTVVSWDYMMATGTTPENMVMIALPQRRQTDTRMVITQLLMVAQILCSALFESFGQMMEKAKGADDGNKPAS